VVKDCPLGSDNANRPMASSTGSAFTAKTNARANSGKEPLSQGRVFALVPGDVQNTEVMVSGILPICSQNACVLIDSGSTHSFVSYTFSQKLTRPLEPMNYLLPVSAPFGSPMICAYVYLACDIVIGGMTLYVDLSPLGIEHFDYILGMDWLMKYCASIDCVNKSVIFHPPRLPEFVFVGNKVVPPPYLISAIKVVKLLERDIEATCVVY